MRIETVSAVGLGSSPAIEAYLFDFSKIAPAYEYDWRDPESFRRRADWLTGGGYRGDRLALAAALERYNRALGADQAALANIALLRQPDTLAVVTGQQAGIFTGPAYSVYKAISAIHLARAQSERLGLPVIPVFWIAGEDHDWPEHASVLVPTADGAARIGLKESFEGERRSVALAPAPDSLPQVIEEFLALLPETEFKAEVADRLRASAAAPPALDPRLTGGMPSLTDWFGRLITWLFAGTGLVLVNSSDPALRALEAPFFEQALRRHRSVEEAFEAGHNRFLGLGFAPTVERQPGNTNLFTYINGDRQPLFSDGDRLFIRDREDLTWSEDELIRLARSEPQRFSTNVVLRPVVQGFLFPDLAYVGGPGELAYFGLYREVFAALDQQMPVVCPRESFTLVEPPLARIMEKNEMTLEDVLFRLDERRQEFLQREDRLGITALFERFRSDFGALYGPLTETVLQLDPTLRQVADENRKQIEFQIGRLEEKARQQHRKNLEVFLRQYDRLNANLTPPGQQERTFSVLPYVAKYGPDLVRRLLEAAGLPDGWVHRAVYLGG